jgi:hypothetical protein
MCVHETRKKDYAAFAAASPGGHEEWKNPQDGRKAVSTGDDHPVVCMTGFDGDAFCEWLSKKEGLRYRLPNNREWSSAAGIFDDPNLPEIRFGWNLPTEVSKDPSLTTLPVMSHSPNKLGIYDLTGNVSELGSDWSPAFDRGDKDALARRGESNRYLPGTKTNFRNLRGGNYHGDSPFEQSGCSADEHRPQIGFRIVVEIEKEPERDPYAAPESESFAGPPASRLESFFIDSPILLMGVLADVSQVMPMKHPQFLEAIRDELPAEEKANPAASQATYRAAYEFANAMLEAVNELRAIEDLLAREKRIEELRPRLNELNGRFRHAFQMPANSAGEFREENKFQTLCLLTIFALPSKTGADILANPLLKSDPHLMQDILHGMVASKQVQTAANMGLTSRFGNRSRLEGAYGLESKVLMNDDASLKGEFTITDRRKPGTPVLITSEISAKRGAVLFLGSFEEADTLPRRLVFVTLR